MGATAIGVQNECLYVHFSTQLSRVKTALSIVWIIYRFKLIKLFCVETENCLM